MILLVVLVLGVGCGFAAGGSLGRLSQANVRGAWLLIVLFALQAALPLIRLSGVLEGAARALWLLTFPVMVVVAAINWREPGMPIVFAGLLLNSLVIAANGAMPISPEAIVAAGGTAAGSAPLPGDFAHVLMVAGTRLRWLADVIPTFGPRGSALLLSPGDVTLFAGVATYVAQTMTGKVRAAR